MSRRFKSSKTSDLPLISCIIPTFNRADKITRAVTSVLIQTWPRLELIIVDDRSTDNTREVVQSLAEKDSRIIYLLNPGKGATSARNYAINHASGEFFAFLDDDDQWLPAKLEKQMACFQKHPDAGLVFTAFKRYAANQMTRRHPSRLSRIRSNKITDRLLKQNFITTSAILVKKDVFQQVGLFDTKQKSFQDWEFLTRISLEFTIIYLNKTLIRQYESNDSITRDKKGRILSSIRHLKKFRSVYQQKPKILSVRYSKMGTRMRKQKRYLFARWMFVRSLKQNSLNMNALFGLLLTKLKI